MTIKDEVEKFLKSRGTPATPKYIAESLGKKQGDANIARALRELVADGKVIRKTRPVQSGWVTYEWNVNYRGTVVTSQGTTGNKFTVGSQWKNRAGSRSIIVDADEECLIVYHRNLPYIVYHYHDGSHIGIRRDLDLIAPWDETPKRSSEVWVNVYANSHGITYSGGHEGREMADSYSSDSRIACVKSPWTEGEFDE